MNQDQIKAVELLSSSPLASSLKRVAENKIPFSVMAIPARGRYMVGVYCCGKSETAVVNEWTADGTVLFSDKDCLHVSEMMEMMSL